MANYNPKPLGANDGAHSYYGVSKFNKSSGAAAASAYAAAVAQQQTAYIPQHMLNPTDTPATTAAAAGPPQPSAAPVPPKPLITSRPVGNYLQTNSNGKRTTVIRSGGGRKWEDPSLLEWDPAHFRLFVGNLGGEVTDDALRKAFIKFPSLSRARVIRDKHQEGKSKGYGFVAFRDPEDYFRAFKEMNGKYIGSHPVLLRKAQTEIKTQTVKGSKPYIKETSAILKASTLGHKVHKHRK